MDCLLAFLAGSFFGTYVTAHIASRTIRRLQYRINYQASVATALTERCADLIRGRWPTAWR